MYCVYFHYLKPENKDCESCRKRPVKYRCIGCNWKRLCVCVTVAVLVCNAVILAVVLINKNKRYGSIQYTLLSVLCIDTIFT